MLDISEITYFQQKKSFWVSVTTLDRYIYVHHFEPWEQCTGSSGDFPRFSAIDDQIWARKPSRVIKYTDINSYKTKNHREIKQS